MKQRNLGLLFLIFLTLAPQLQAKEQAKPSEVARLKQAVVASYTFAFEFGNYQACLRLQPLFKRALELAPEEGAGGPLVFEVQRLVMLVASGNYSQAIAPAQALLQRKELADSVSNKLLLHYCLIRCGQSAGFPLLVDTYLPEAIRLANLSKDPEDRFALACMAVQRSLEKQPDLPLEVLIQQHDECCRMLEGFQPNSGTTGGAEVSRGFRFWLREWFRRSLKAPKLQARLRALVDRDLNRLGELSARGIQQTNLQYVIGLMDAGLEVAQLLREQGEFGSSRLLLSRLDQQFVVIKEQIVGNLQTAFDGLFRDTDKLTPSGAKLDLGVLHFSLLEGDISRVDSRLNQEWIRLWLDEHPGANIDPATREELHRHLQRARQAQAVAARGQGFLGMEEVRWDALALLLRFREDGWQQEAGPLIQESLQLSRKLNFRLGEIAALSYQGDLLKAQADPAGALRSFQQAAALAEKFVTESGGDEAAASRTRQRFKHLFDAVTELQLESGKPEEAFATQGRLQELKLVGQANSAKLNQAVTLRGRTGALEQELVARKASGQETRPVEELLARTRGEFYAELTKIRSANPKYESMLAVRPVNFAPLQKKIPANVCLIQYFPAETSLFIFVATSTDLKIHKVAIAYSELRTLVTQFRRSILTRADTSYQAPLVKLHAALIEPLEADLASKEILAFVPTGALDYLPLGALARTAPSGSGLEYLIQRKQVAVILKSSDLDALGGPPSRPTGGVLALGNPDGTLPGAALEAQALTQLFPGSQLYLGKDATADHLNGGMAYLHLATHGVLDSSDPNASYLVLSGGKPRLTVQQIFDLHLEGVRLVTLSACETALGHEEGTQGSELSTLAGAFSIAGSNSVVASLWSVEDESTRLLMTEFYSALTQGKSLAAALQQAQIKLLSQSRYASPFFWAPFELIGDWR